MLGPLGHLCYRFISSSEVSIFVQNYYLCNKNLQFAHLLIAFDKLFYFTFFLLLHLVIRKVCWLMYYCALSIALALLAF